MQLGSRWRVGDPPHAAVPELLRPAIAAAEAALTDADPTAGTDPVSGADSAAATGASWTLTWLEGRPRVELLDATATVRADLSIDATGAVRAAPVGLPAGSADSSAPEGANTVAALDEDDDDDWLS